MERCPSRLAGIDAVWLSYFQAELRKPYTVRREVFKNGKRTTKKVTKPGLSDITIASVLRHLRPALVWAVSMGMLPSVPAMHPPKKAKGQTLMRGRPITAEEFDRMIAVIPKVRPQDAAAWTRAT